jgi:hypothetical protein
MIMPARRMKNATFIDHSGNPNGSDIMSTNSRIMKAAAIYTARTCVTFLRFNSCQNLDSLLGLWGMQVQILIPQDKELGDMSQIDPKNQIK